MNRDDEHEYKLRRLYDRLNESINDQAELLRQLLARGTALLTRMIEDL